MARNSITPVGSLSAPRGDIGVGAILVAALALLLAVAVYAV